jgi:hypothetical protein
LLPLPSYPSVYVRARIHVQLKVHLANGSYLVLSDVPSDSLLARKNIAVGDAILTVRCGSCSETCVLSVVAARGRGGSPKEFGVGAIQLDYFAPLLFG